MQESNVLSYSKIALHVQNPDFEDVWMEGFEASENNQDEETNPYMDNSIAYEIWSQGWWAAFYGEEALFGSATQEKAELGAFPEPNFVIECLQTALESIKKIISAALAALLIYEVMFTVS